MKTLATMNVKGGVGKTMTACNMAHILSEDYNQRVLLADCDPQANATAYFAANADCGGMTELLTGSFRDYADLICPTSYKRLDIIPCDSSLFSVDIDTIRDSKRGDLGALQDMADAMRKADRYDVIILDLPPSFTAASIAALSATDSVIIPVKMDAFSTAGMDFLMDQMAAVTRISGRLRLDGVLVTLWHNCECNTQLERVLRTRGIHVFETHIRRSDKADESTWFCQPICDYSRYSSTARDYRQFVAEYVRDGGLKNG